MAEAMRERILAAAVDVVTERGIAAATTKEIARAAGVSEGSLYNHFGNKTELIGATMAELAGGVRDAMLDLLGRVGAGTVEDNLVGAAEAVIGFYGRLLPVTGSVYGDPVMLAQIRREMPEQGLGPLRGHEALIGYLGAEQRAGRIAAELRPPDLAAALLGSCQQYAFLVMLVEPEQLTAAAGLSADRAEYARGIVRLLLR
ncbi:TetR/AcrR family transcriptional regulator [Streptacidiphilus sp. EB129]|uniref:TetR/AcrR family transcriptional regulator n=1 Tax=Streptacidiphilus sp. EB129 TaxID=3156262 RepID=UPI003513591A